MILEGLFQLFLLILGILTVALPTYNVPQSLGLDMLKAADYILPLSELGLVMGAVIAYATASLLYNLVMKGINLVRGSGA